MRRLHTIGRTTLSGWRETIQPRVPAWWRRLDKLNPFCTFFASLITIISFGLLLKIALQFLSAGANFLNVSEVLVGLLAGGTIIQIGRSGITQLLSWIGIRPERQHGLKTLLAIALLSFVLALNSSLPTIARGYNDEGVGLQDAKQLSSAIGKYRLAISLNPEYAEAHYNLASAFEDLLDYDGAIGEYQQAIGYYDRFYAPYNNLARLYMLRYNDYARAIKLLDTALEFTGSRDLPDESQRKSAQYSIHKNRGWAYSGLGMFELAEADLRTAIEMDGDGPAAHCLLAQVLERQKNQKEAEAEKIQEQATDNWKKCVAMMTPEREFEVEPDWLGLARERLEQIANEFTNQ